MNEIIKNTIPSILLMWFIFLIELLNMDYLSILETEAIISDLNSTLSFSYYYQNFVIFILYTIVGFIFGTISYVILYKKRKRKFSLLSRSDEWYLIFFLKSSLLSFAILSSLLLREVINQPSLFQTTLLNKNFIFYFIVNFFYSFFSPLYFTCVLIFIISIFFFKLMKLLNIEEGVFKITTYAISVIVLFLLLFNYGFLNAINYNNFSDKSITNKKGKYNLLMIGVEGLERKIFSKRFSDKYLFENFRGFYDIKSRSYNFQNCFTTSLEAIPSLISSINGLHPDYSNYIYNIPYVKDKILHREKFNNYFEKLRNEFNYNIYITGNNKFRYFKNYLKTKNSKLFDNYNTTTDFELKFPTDTENSDLLSSVIIRHPFFISFISNTLMLNQFEEITSSKYYTDNRFFRKEMINFINKTNLLENFDDSTIRNNNETNKLFAILKLISKSDNIRLPYPYDSMSDSKGIVNKERNYTKYVDEEIQILIGKLKHNNLYEKTTIVLFGIPDSNKKILSEKSNLFAQDLKIPLLISSPDYKKEIVVKRNYSNLDIYPTSFELVTGHSLRDKVDGVSLLDTVFVRRDIFISEKFDDLIERIGLPDNTTKKIFDSTNVFKWNNLFVDKKIISNNKKITSNRFKNINNKYKSLLSLFTKRTYIRGDYKMNIYPKPKHIEYQLFDIKTDPLEKKNIADMKKRILDRMISRMQDNYEKRFGYSFINGYFIKQ